MGNCLQAFLRQHAREYESPRRNRDCQISSFADSYVTYTRPQNEELLYEPMFASEIKPVDNNEVFKLHLINTVEKKRRREWEEQKNCDIEIRCGELKTHAHSVVLSNVSDYFKANLKFNKHKRSISLNEEFVSPDALNDVINFAYTGILEISTDRLQDVIATASYLQVKHIFDECEKGLINNVVDPSVISLLPFAIRYDLTNLIDSIILRLSENFETFVEQNAFCSLSNDDFKFLLMNRNLSVFRKGIPVDNHELHILDAVGKTLTVNQVNDISTVRDILSTIRFSEIPKENLSDLYNTYPAFQILDEFAFSNLQNNILPKRKFSKIMKVLENSKVYAKNPHWKIRDQFRLVKVIENISDINDRPRKVELWVTRWEGFFVIGGIRMEYKSRKSVLCGIPPKARHSIVSEHEFEMDEDEVIININLRTGMLVYSISFLTNYGHIYGPYGSNRGIPSSLSPSQKRGYFHSFRGIVLKGRFNHFFANIECAWVVFKTRNNENDSTSLVKESFLYADLFPYVHFDTESEYNLLRSDKHNRYSEHSVDSEPYVNVALNKHSLAYKF